MNWRTISTAKRFSIGGWISTSHTNKQKPARTKSFKLQNAKKEKVSKKIGDSSLLSLLLLAFGFWAQFAVLNVHNQTLHSCVEIVVTSWEPIENSPSNSALIDCGFESVAAHESLESRVLVVGEWLGLALVEVNARVLIGLWRDECRRFGGGDFALYPAIFHVFGDFSDLAAIFMIVT